MDDIVFADVMFAIGNDTAGGSLKLRHEGTGFTNFKIDGGADLAADTNHVIPIGAHTITYTDATDNEDRIFTITVNANGQDIDAMSLITTFAPPTVEGTQEVIANFIGNRAGNLLNNQPNIGGFIDGSGAVGGSNPFGALSAYGATSFTGSDFKMSYANSLSRVARLSQSRVERTMEAAYKQQPQSSEKPFQHVLSYDDDGASDAVPAATRRWDVWMQVYGAHSDVGDTSTDFWVGYAGAHYFVTPDVIIGALAQLDYADEDNSVTGNKADGFGWMIGPYLAAKLPDHPLYFEARAAWGQSDNNIKLATFGAEEDEFDTTRWLASAKLSGAFEIRSITIKPSVRVSYFNEKQHSYVDSFSTTIAAQTTEIGELRWGPTFSTTIETDDGLFITPSLGVHGIWNFVADDVAGTSGTLPGTEDVRSTVDAGLGISNASGLSFNVTGFYDGIGLDDYEAYGGTARVSVPFQ
ncbi:MAG: hypothetical protein COA52_10045 [Hyphomicrobiales bacterium]|nr:MAG: hypothetical protein COA52_10045 [Hyphomicrobiales bacterium]